MTNPTTPRTYMDSLESVQTLPITPFDKVSIIPLIDRAIKSPKSHNPTCNRGLLKQLRSIILDVLAHRKSDGDLRPIKAKIREICAGIGSTCHANSVFWKELDTRYTSLAGTYLFPPQDGILTTLAKVSIVIHNYDVMLNRNGGHLRFQGVDKYLEAYEQKDWARGGPVHKPIYFYEYTSDWDKGPPGLFDRDRTTNFVTWAAYQIKKRAKPPGPSLWDRCTSVFQPSIKPPEPDYKEMIRLGEAQRAKLWEESQRQLREMREYRKAHPLPKPAPIYSPPPVEKTNRCPKCGTEPSTLNPLLKGRNDRTPAVYYNGIACKRCWNRMNQLSTHWTLTHR